MPAALTVSSTTVCIPTPKSVPGIDAVPEQATLPWLVPSKLQEQVAPLLDHETTYDVLVRPAVGEMLAVQVGTAAALTDRDV